jgi:RHS repeat-associated protein
MGKKQFWFLSLDEIRTSSLTTCSRADAGSWTNYPFLTSKERDNETGLDYFGARYYASTQGRFTSADPLISSGAVESPQSWNRYTYVLNNPLRFIDPNGLYEFDASVTEEQRKGFRSGLAKAQANLQKIAQVYGTNSKEYKNAERAVNVYGAEGVKNGVTIKATTDSNANPGETGVAGVAGAKTADNPTGQLFESRMTTTRKATFGNYVSMALEK